MIENFLIVAIVSLVLGIFFFVADFYEHTHPRLHVSLIAGISLAYFFLVLLPEVAVGIPIIPFEIVIFEYLFVVIGFSFVHISEKLILQKVEANSQKRMRKLLQKCPIRLRQNLKESIAPSGLSNRVCNSSQRPRISAVDAKARGCNWPFCQSGLPSTEIVGSSTIQQISPGA